MSMFVTVCRSDIIVEVREPVGRKAYCYECMRVCRKQALSRVKYYYYVINSKIQQQQ